MKCERRKMMVELHDDYQVEECDGEVEDGPFEFQGYFLCIECGSAIGLVENIRNQMREGVN